MFVDSLLGNILISVLLLYHIYDIGIVYFVDSRLFSQGKF
nr:MAG TPA: hypothetical protein [Caudoviricetes sp.]